MALALAVYDYGSNLVATLTDQAQGMRHSTGIPGGMLECSFRLQRPARLWYPDLRYNYTLTLSDNNGIVWRGRIDRMRPVLTQDGEYLEVTVLGDGVNADDQVYTTKTFTSTTAIETCVSTVRTDLMPKVTAESLVATSRTLTADLVTSGRAREVLNLLVAFGDTNNAPLIWSVWPDGAAGIGQLQLAIWSATADYIVDLRDVAVTFGFDGRHYANLVRVNYSSGTLWRIVQDTVEQSNVNLTREMVVEVADVTNATDADNIGNTALTAAKLLTPNAETAAIAAPWAVTDSMRATVPLWRVRSGKVIQIEGLFPSEGLATTLDWHNSFKIIQTEYEHDTGVLSLTFERLENQLMGILAKLVGS